MGNSTVKIRKLKERKKVNKNNKEVNKTAMHECQEESKRATSNLLNETTYLIVVFKIDVFFVFLKEELTNNSTSENLE